MGDRKKTQNDPIIFRVFMKSLSVDFFSGVDSLLWGKLNK